MNSECKQIRKNILRASHVSGHGHIPTSFSVIECLYAVYKSMRHDPKNPLDENRDIFILSKGHASLGHYCTLAQFGYFDAKEVEAFGQFESRFGCHADRHKVPGVEVSTGSLGHGIGLAVGMALGLKIRQSDRRVYVLVGDGESNEGTVWESLMVASHLGLNNLTIVFDDNKSQERCLPVQNPAAKFRSFGCDVFEIDGHDVDALSRALQEESSQVKVIVADTLKGYGCKTFVEEKFAWHRRSPNQDEYQQLLGELDA